MSSAFVRTRHAVHRSVEKKSTINGICTHDDAEGNDRSTLSLVLKQLGEERTRMYRLI